MGSHHACIGEMYGYHDDRADVDYAAGGGRRGGGGGGGGNARFAPYERSGGRGGGGGDRVLVPTKIFITNLAWETSWQNLKVQLFGLITPGRARHDESAWDLHFKFGMHVRLRDCLLAQRRFTGSLQAGERTLTRAAPRASPAKLGTTTSLGTLPFRSASHGGCL